MADHKAEQIMDAVKTALTSLTTTGSNVVRGRAFAFAESTTDALSIFMGDDVSVNELMSGTSKEDWKLTFEVVAHTKNTDPEQRLNLIKKEVVVALKADYTLGGKAIFITEKSWTKPEIFGDYDTRMGVCVGTFEALYRRSYTDPSA